MGKIYCMNCNEATTFGAKKPVICGFCGQSYLGAVASVAPTVQSRPVFVPTITQTPHRGKLNRQIEDNDEIDHPEDATTVPQIDKLDFNVNLSDLLPNRENGRDVYNSGSQSEAREVFSRQPVKSEKISKARSKEIQQQSRQEVQEQFKTQLASKKRSGSSTEIGG